MKYRIFLNSFYRIVISLVRVQNFTQGGHNENSILLERLFNNNKDLSKFTKSTLFLGCRYNTLTFYPNSNRFTLFKL